jgi:hypothetical protein
MLGIPNDKNSLKVLSDVFSPAGLRRMIAPHDQKNVILKKLRKHTSSSCSSNVSDTIAQLYRALLFSYRTEYFYKNTLLTEELLKKYKLTSTVVLNEFKIGKSKADFVLLNGECRIYEIKSDLDGLHKLSKQISDYKKFSDKVYIVTCEKFIDRITTDYQDSSVGIILFSEQNKLVEVKAATSDASSLNHDAIFKTLRKNEYIELVENCFGFRPDVPNTKIFSVCNQLVHKIEIGQFQRLAVEKLKQRTLQCSKLLKSTSTPKELKYLCYVNDLSESEYNRLYKFLNLSY